VDEMDDESRGVGTFLKTAATRNPGNFNVDKKATDPGNLEITQTRLGLATME
jgi:hypothetical protein